MRKIRLGRTEILATNISFGVLPIQRVDFETAKSILCRAYEAGINYYDTARSYTDSEEKIGYALSDVRKEIFIATKSPSLTGEGVRKDIETSLKMLKTDYIDVLQMHNPPFCPKPGEDNGIYDALLKAKQDGLILHIGITNHREHVAREAIASGLYELLQFPFTYISGDSEFEVKELCVKNDMGFVAMKALAGGLLSNAGAVYTFFEQHPDALPIYGMQHMHELEEFLSFDKNPPKPEDYKTVMEKDIQELKGNFCRNCGYCLPCPQGIKVDHISRVYYNLRRMPLKNLMNDEWKGYMDETKNCTGCGACSSRCPYNIDPPSRFEFMYDDYMQFYNNYSGN